ncbi:assimilatory sulfite reductase (NADPH) flavoprotein subunit [Pseudoalteromonas shioyasakiensis]|uniref:assimilatory sulfite reductase (NADPH) flavoprotein subunit n=1 Tax=Pseudoalteromonas shioyasakiensis TaxID=1190813 RepID=UPI002118B7D2|nr:assimilatory sulfite reductase (NADPH) flavoprotein subunit [Pseudoalteromonas shioyasakiensis]MCQ8879326.1 assimilatory sulfite reductase (NADPH) flavoprotein subunit [Pseudoalteromonas shioyasakiensis]
MLLGQLNAAASPLSQEQVQKLQGLVAELNPIQQAWVSGYLAANANTAALGGVVGAAPSAGEAAALTILYGSQTGNSKGVATKLKEQAESRGLAVKLVSMADYKPTALKKEKFLTVVVSTYGEGEPPEDAETLHEFLTTKKAPKLDGVKIAVIGLGDSSYEFFCQTAKDFEERLNKLGAETIYQRADLDVDYDDEAATWITGALDAFEPDLKAQQDAGGQVVSMPFGAPAPAAAASQYTKQNPFAAELSTVQKITGRDSTKDVRHVEISLEGSDITYTPGDSLGVYFLNDEVLVDEVLELTQIDAASPVKIGDEELSIRDALIEKLELTQSYPGFVEKYAVATGTPELLKLVEDKAAMREYIEPRQIFDVIRQNPAKIEAQTLVDCLRKLQARLYSIASSQAEVEDEVHLTIGLVEFDAFGSEHLGGCSGYLARRAEEGCKVKVFSEHNDNFRLPSNDDTPVIMVGPGTGIAPFRAFLQERDSREASGKNWLFFGNPHFTQDFLYQVEIQGYLKSGLLSKVDVAFSRDQAEKVYVQDKLRQNSKEVFAWLEAGAHIYICGDANRMAKDVHNALVDIISENTDKSFEDADQYLKDLRSANRYQKDVY